MILHFNIYDDKPTNIKSHDFKTLIADSVKKALLKDWDKYVKVNQYKEMNSGKKEYHTEITLWED